MSMTDNLLTRTIIAMTNLYGICRKDLVLEIYNSQNEDKVSDARVQALLDQLPAALDKAHIEVEDDCFVHEAVLEFDEFDELLAQQAGKPRYIPPNDMLLLYAQEFYFEQTDAFKALLDFVRRQISPDDEKRAYEVAEDIQGTAGIKVELEYLLSELSRYGANLLRLDIKLEAVQILNSLIDNTRTWQDNGLTPLELEATGWQPDAKTQAAKKLLEQENAEMERELRETLYEINRDFAQHCLPVHDLAAFLGFRTVAQLRHIARLLKIGKTARLKKADLIAVILQDYKNSLQLGDVLMTSTRDAWRRFLMAARTQSLLVERPLPVQYLNLQQLALIQLFYHDGRFWLVVPDEIKAVFKKLDTPDFITRKHRHDEILDYALAAVNLYGVIRLVDFVDLYNRLSSETIDINIAEDVLNPQANFSQDFFSWNDCLVSSAFSPEDPADFEEVYLAQRGKPRYIPTVDELYHYIDSDYYEETAQISALADFLLQYFDEDDVWEILDDVHDMIQSDLPPSAIFGHLIECGIRVDRDAELGQIVKLIADVHNNTRRWSLNGYKPIEQNEQSGSKILRFPTDKPIVSVKVGRNDPCPCGSGKKYKHCCGK